MRVLTLLAIIFSANFIFSQSSALCVTDDLISANTSSITNHCNNIVDIDIDIGNFMYIPNNNTPILTLRVNFHVMQFDASNPLNFENIPAHLTYLNNLISFLNNEIYNSPGYQEDCNGATTTAPPMIDSRIRIQLNQIFFHVDEAGHSNDSNTGDGGGIIDDYNLDTYLVGQPIFDNALNIFLHICPK